MQRAFADTAVTSSRGLSKLGVDALEHVVERRAVKQLQ
jgi:hypothetical protein